MEISNGNDQQGIEICKNVGQILGEELDYEGVWDRVEKMLVDYFKSIDTNMDFSDLTGKFEWALRVQLKKSFFLKPFHFLKSFGGDRFGE